MLLANELKAKGKLDHRTLSGFFLTERFSSKCSCLGNPWIFSSQGRDSLKFSWVVFMMSQTGFITFMIYGLGICLCALLFFSEADIGETWTAEVEKVTYYVFFPYNCIGWQILGAKMWIVCPGQNGVHKTYVIEQACKRMKFYFLQRSRWIGQQIHNIECLCLWQHVLKLGKECYLDKIECPKWASSVFFQECSGFESPSFPRKHPTCTGGKIQQ